MAEDEAKPFDPQVHLTKLGSKDYLEVKWRIAWLRDKHPDAHLLTNIVSHTPEEAVFCASVTIPDGGSATGYGSETPGDFGDYLEKAETKAIGRALAALGFGTQFCNDFDEGGAVTDSPVARKNTTARPTVADDRKSSEAQHGLIGRMLTDHFGDDAQAKVACITTLEPKAVSGTSLRIGELTVGQASELIKKLQQKPAPEKGEASPLAERAQELGEDPGPISAREAIAQRARGLGMADAHDGDPGPEEPGQ